nr:unnamed protein product [Digitaria exilis]
MAAPTTSPLAMATPATSPLAVVLPLSLLHPLAASPPCRPPLPHAVAPVSHHAAPATARARLASGRSGGGLERLKIPDIVLDEEHHG